MRANFCHRLIWESQYQIDDFVFYFQRRFLPDCQFRENVEKNNFNTYASELYSNHETREGFFLAISRRGKIPKRLQRVNWKQKRAHWLPRNV